MAYVWISRVLVQGLSLKDLDSNLLWNDPHFLFFTLTLLFLIMWSSCDHIVTHCTCDGYCPVTSIVLWPIVQGDSIVPVTAIVLVTLLFSFTISTSSLWPYSLRLDFCILRYRQPIRVLFPTLIPCPFPLKVFALRPPDCLSGYHLSPVTVKVPFRTLPLYSEPWTPVTQCLGEWLNPHRVNVPTVT